MRRELFHLEPKMKKKYSEWVEPESELEDDEQIETFEEEYYKEKKKELTEGWERSKKTLEETGGTAEDIATRKEKADKKLEELEADYKIWVQHRKKAGYSFRGKEPDERKSLSADQLIKMIEKQTDVIAKTKLKQNDKESLKTVSLTTRSVLSGSAVAYLTDIVLSLSKINYLDPRFVRIFLLRMLSDIYPELPLHTALDTNCPSLCFSLRHCARNVSNKLCRGSWLTHFTVPWAMDAKSDWRF